MAIVEPSLLESLLSAVEIGQVTFASIGILCTLMIISGKLITLREHKETRADRDVWRSSSLEKDETIATQARQIEIAERGRELGLSLMAKIDQVVEQKMRGGDAE